MKTKRFVYVLPVLLILLLAVLVGCSPEDSVAEVSDEAAPAEEPESEDAASLEPDFSSFPVTVESCGEPVTFDAPPERAVTNDLNITEIFLSLGLEEKLVGYSGVSAWRHELHSEWDDELARVPELSPEYIDLETLVGAGPDFFFAGWFYGFSEDKGITPESLEQYGIKSYVLTESCIRVMDREKVSLEDTFTDILNIGRIFGIEEHAQAQIDQYRAELVEIQAAISEVGSPLRVFVYDSGEDSPYTGAKYAMINAMIESAGATNIFNDVESSWVGVNWEDIIDRNPEFIVIVDYGEKSADEKIEFLKSQPELADIDAIVNDNFVVLGYDEVTPGPRNVSSTLDLAEAFYPSYIE